MAVGLLREHACLLRFGAGIDFDKEQRAAPLLGDLFAERFGEARAIHGMDGLEQLHGLLCLVRLQRADQVQFEAGAT